MSTGMKIALVVILLAAAAGGYFIFGPSTSSVPRDEEAKAVAQLRPVLKKGATPDSAATPPVAPGGAPAAASAPAAAPAAPPAH